MPLLPLASLYLPTFSPSHFSPLSFTHLQSLSLPSPSLTSFTSSPFNSPSLHLLSPLLFSSPLTSLLLTSPYLSVPVFTSPVLPASPPSPDSLTTLVSLPPPYLLQSSLPAELMEDVYYKDFYSSPRPPFRFSFKAGVKSMIVSVIHVSFQLLPCALVSFVCYLEKEENVCVGNALREDGRRETEKDK